jgi:large conductance mechanosensitive channel
VDGVIMPPIGKLIGGVNFNELSFVIQEAVVGADGKETAAEVAIKYGAFLQTVIDFTIIAFVLFMVIKLMNRLKRTEAAAPPPPAEPSEEVVLLREIRDALKK